jgi:hypothetical protein
MKIIPKENKTYEFKLTLSQKEAIKLYDELKDIKQEDIDYSGIVPRVTSINGKLFMVLSDALQDLELIEMTTGRKKGDKSQYRLENDEVEVIEK